MEWKGRWQARLADRRLGGNEGGEGKGRLGDASGLQTNVVASAKGVGAEERAGCTVSPLISYVHIPERQCKITLVANCSRMLFNHVALHRTQKFLRCVCRCRAVRYVYDGQK